MMGRPLDKSGLTKFIPTSLLLAFLLSDISSVWACTPRMDGVAVDRSSYTYQLRHFELYFYPLGFLGLIV